MLILAALVMLMGWAEAVAQSTGGVSTATDIFLMPGSDFARPGSRPRVNLNLGVGHTFSRLPWAEITASYTYENGGSHGFWHTQQGAHTEAVGAMRKFSFNFSQRQQQRPSPLGAYLWTQVGVTSLTGQARGGVANRIYSGQAAGLTMKLSEHSSIWLQESYNKVVTAPWYTSTGVGYVFSF